MKQVHMAAESNLRVTALAGSAVLFCVMGIGRFGLTPVLPAMIKAGQVDPLGAGLLASVNFLGYLAGALMLAAWPVGLTRPHWLIVAVSASVLTTGAMAFLTDFPLQIALRFVGGLASTLAMALASAVVFSRCAARPVMASGIFYAGVGGGIACSAVVTELMLAQGAAWQQLWLGLAGTALIPAWLAARHLAPRLDWSTPVASPNERGRTRDLPPLMVAYFLFGYGYVITSTFIVTQVRNTPALQSLKMEVWLVVGLSAVPAAGLWYSLAIRRGYATAFSAACLIEAIGIALSATGTNSTLILASAAIFGFTFMGISPLGILYAAAIGQASTARVVGMMSATFGLGQIIGPVVAGYLITATGSYLPAIASSVASLLLAALLTVPAALRERQRRLNPRAPLSH